MSGCNELAGNRVVWGLDKILGWGGGARHVVSFGRQASLQQGGLWFIFLA